MSRSEGYANQRSGWHKCTKTINLQHLHTKRHNTILTWCALAREHRIFAVACQHDTPWPLCHCSRQSRSGPQPAHASASLCSPVCLYGSVGKNKKEDFSSSIVFAQGEDSMKKAIQRRTAIQQADICQTCIQLKRKSYQDGVERTSDVQRHLRATHLHHLSQVKKQQKRVKRKGE